MLPTRLDLFDGYVVDEVPKADHVNGVERDCADRLSDLEAIVAYDLRTMVTEQPQFHRPSDAYE